MDFAPSAETVVDFSRDIWSVSRLASEVRAVLEGSFPLLWVRGEISNLSRPASGHIYFSLKDEGAQVRCAMFRHKRRLLSFEPANGTQVLLRARVGLYEPRGDFQLVVEHMEAAGEGALRLQLERLKQRLAAEGLFNAAHKRPLPPFPRQVGLITSASGAAVHDLLTVLRRRLPLLPVLIYPVPVQGDDAAGAMVEALGLANRRADCDLLILARGGGALEDLMAFNDEALVRAIRASAIPVLTGIGHEVDITLADLAADQRGATPSAAAELAVPSAEQLMQRLDVLQARLFAAQRRRLDDAGRRIDRSIRHLRLLHPMARLQQLAQRLDQCEFRLKTATLTRLGVATAALAASRGRLLRATPRWAVESYQARVHTLDERLRHAAARLLPERAERLSALAHRLDALSPLSTLARGYAIVRRTDSGEVVRNADAVPDGAHITVTCQQGELTARVERG
ncbi:exodeoxyribonuclease VII large subunit [Thiohalocapsa marina]|uniref:Exodeoxyribonuclease 7 large subunit n=1 Tax=Thiohalocapsa marina TaxID=424902 RepID=A0A5M8FJ00_9GAMM|nr:exodeoxyribonuclease VII large subunit [Thiohalocapsa marina]KAA6184464.1 exodeoxyribonuclease VII large subunit [Thiohalocapsa marina]